MGKPIWTTTRAAYRKATGVVGIFAGDTGRVEIHRTGAIWVPRDGKNVSLKPGLWGLSVTPTGPVAFAVDGTPWMVRDSDFVQAGPKPAGFTARDRTTGAWDPTRQATILMSGRPDKGKAKLKDAWAFNGATMTRLVIEPPVRVVDGGSAFSPALGALVVAGGSETWKGEPAPTYEIRSGRSASFPPVPSMQSIWLATDPASGLVVATGTNASAAYLGSGMWRALPPPPQGTCVEWFDPATRVLHATVQVGPMRSQHACVIGAVLDALALAAPARIAGATRPNKRSSR
jgi:hypothetical protein